MRASPQGDPATIRSLELSAPASIPQAGSVAGNGVNNQLRQVGEPIHVLDMPQLLRDRRSCTWGSPRPMYLFLYLFNYVFLSYHLLYNIV